MVASEKKNGVKHVFCLQRRKYSLSDCLAHVRQLDVDSLRPRLIDCGGLHSLISERYLLRTLLSVHQVLLGAYLSATYVLM
jgi:hypothetical protein